MSGLRQIITAALIGLVIFIILAGGFASSFQEADLFGTVVAEAPEESTTENVAPLVPVELDPEQTPTPASSFATMTPTQRSASCPAPAGWEVTTVKLGDTIESIADEFGVDPQVIRARNCLIVDDLVPGSRIYVPLLAETATSTNTVVPVNPTVSCGPPAGWISYTVKQGDTLFSISTAYFITVEELKLANCLTSNLITVGRRLAVPNVATRTPVATATPKPTKTPTSVPPSPTQPQATDTPDTPLPPTDTPLPTETPVTPTVPPSITPTIGATATPLPSETPTTPPPPTNTAIPSPTASPAP
ncbi:MAG: LysM peptidoglycan-binding domain-containing protein [Anaerolineales bacterium]|nr:LysM peptidoglycan-binding domain-containing protein [Anaerolineales bacterium]